MTQADHEARARELCGCDLCMGWEENLDGVRMEAMCQRGAAITAALDAADKAGEARERKRWVGELAIELNIINAKRSMGDACEQYVNLSDFKVGTIQAFARRMRVVLP